MRSVARAQNTSKRKSVFIIIFSVLGTVALIAGFSQLKPRTITCITSLHTFCPPELEEKLIPLQKTHILLVARKLKKEEPEILQHFQHISNLKGHFTPTLAWEVEAEYSQPLFPIQFHDQTYLVYQNQTLIQTDSSPSPVFFTPEESWIEGGESPKWKQPLSNLALTNLKLLIERESLYPTPVQKIEVRSEQEVIVFLSSGQKILLRIDQENFSDTLNTLQSFFHSTTIENTWYELDVRFDDIVVR